MTDPIHKFIAHHIPNADVNDVLDLVEKLGVLGRLEDMAMEWHEERQAIDITDHGDFLHRMRMEEGQL